MKHVLNRFFSAAALIGIAVPALLLLTGCSSATPSLETDFDISPDGKTIVFTGSGSGVQDLYLLDLASRRVRRVCDTPSDEIEPRFTPDGRRIVFAAGPPSLDAPTHIYSCNLDGSGRRQITGGKLFEQRPVCLSADGTRIAFIRSTLRRPYSFGGNISVDWDLWTVDAATGREKQITHVKNSGIFSTDIDRNYARVLYTGWGDYPDTNTYAWTVPADGSAKPTRVPASSPKWGDQGPGYAVYAGNAIDIMAGPCSDTPAYSWEIDSAASGSKKVTRLAVVPHLLDSIQRDRADSFIYSIVDSADNPRAAAPQLWRLNLATKKTEMIAGSDLFTDPLGSSK